MNHKVTDVTCLLGLEVEKYRHFQELKGFRTFITFTDNDSQNLYYLFSSSFTIPEENEESDDWNKGHFFSENSESEQASTIEEENLVSYQSVL